MRRDRAIKVLLSLVAVAAFGALGWAAFSFSPFGVGTRAPAPASMMTPGPGKPSVPVPPDTREVFTTASEAGRHWSYESRLAPEGLWMFYTREMPRQGWARDEVFESVRRDRTPGQQVLAFKAQEAVCIIGIEPTDSFTAAVTVLVLDAADPDAQAP